MTVPRDDAGFSPRLVIAVVAVGIVAFVALWALIALGPQLSSGNNGGGHALSKGATGYAGIVDLAERSDVSVDLLRRPDRGNGRDWHNLLILTPTHTTRPEEIRELLDTPGEDPVLIVLPKWIAGRIPGQALKPGWVSGGSVMEAPERLLPADLFGKVVIGIAPRPAARALLEAGSVSALIDLPEQVQTLRSDRIDTLLAGPGGSAVLARLSDREIYILAEPDLIDNMAFASRDRARGALLLLDAVAEEANADALAFDLTLNGFGSQRSLLRFAFVPPFIGITLCLIAAGLLALWQAWVRFGPALKPERAFALSRVALIDHSADLVRQAGRELDGAAAYVRSVRGAIARRLHAPPGLDEAATDAWIDRLLHGGNPGFATLASRLPLARSTHELLADAQALHAIRKELLGDH